ncbi:FAD-binding oxidoreductase [Pigmentiphaga kullae]|uniref:FAD/FMN-containing dehydrogenase n=1 Tax=Pigmentiphaga kullae TaxID=151784 RepID=A0A4Q7NCZ2_9BURK|nr:FAD-binding oxidoreductase [Pigmentiphaga kullae]RZS80856.1 FAD/FMN-containing dehydrogenase [Pigmentiphaga kullae]
MLSDNTTGPSASETPHSGTELDRQVSALVADLSDSAGFLSSGNAGPRYQEDWTGAFGASAPVLRPRTVAALAETVRRLHGAGLRIVAQGGMSGLVGGGAPMRGEVVVSLERLNRIESCDLYGATMTVQAGATLQAVQEEAERQGLFYPVDLGSRGSCTVGGNIATNAGGNRVLQYGMTRASVLGLEVVLPDGTLVSRMGRVAKDNAGYDLKQLFIGSEGTLGIVARAVLRLHPLPRQRYTVALGLQDLDQVLRALAACRADFGPMLTSFEVMWRDFVDFVARGLGIGRDPFAGACGYVVLIELSCYDRHPERDEARIMDALEALSENLGTPHVVVAKSLSEAAGLWRMRDASGEAARHLGAYLSFDVSIPTGELQSCLPRIYAGLDAIDPALRRLTYGHLGDGNVHLLVGCAGPAAEHVEHLVYHEVMRCGGSISAEHGIGLEKNQVFQRLYPAAELDAMRRIKLAFDPGALLGRDRVFGLS